MRSVKNSSSSLFAMARICIIILYLCTSLTALGSIPSTLNPDEASIAYNAALLLQTNQDEWGFTWPLVLEAFGDQKVIGYTALVVPSLALFGYNDAAVRVPVVLAGLGILLLTDRILQQWRFTRFTRFLALLTLTLQPFFIWYTRVAFEATVSLFFVLGVIYFLFRPTESLENKPHSEQWWQLGLLILSLIGSLLTYNSPVIILPLLVLLLPFWHGTLSVTRFILPGISVVLVWGIFLLLLLQLTEQKSQITLFGDPTTQAAYGVYREQFNGIWQRLLGNYYVFLAGQKVQNALWQFHPGFLLFNSPGHPWHALAGTGYLTFTALMAGYGNILWRGMHALKWVRSQRKKYRLSPVTLVVLITLIALVPAAISVNAPHATRSLLFFWGWVVLAAVFLQDMVSWLGIIFLKKLGIQWSQLRTRQVMMGGISLAMVLPSLLYIHRLWVQYPQDAQLQYALEPGYEQVLQSIESDYPEAEVAVVDDRGFRYIITAWYLKMKPEVFFSTIIRQQADSINFRYGEQVGRYRFVRSSQDLANEKLLVWWDEEIKNWIVTTK